MLHGMEPFLSEEEMSFQNLTPAYLRNPVLLTPLERSTLNDGLLNKAWYKEQWYAFLCSFPFIYQSLHPQRNFVQPQIVFAAA